MLTQLLTRMRQVPTRDNHDQVVSWHVFRTLSEAESYAEHVVLNDGQYLVGGTDHDSIGTLWWVGVEVDDIAKWGNGTAVNKHAA